MTIHSRVYQWVILLLVFAPIFGNAQTMIVDFVDAQLEYNQKVGNDWSIWIEVNGVKLSKGKSIKVSEGQRSVIEAHAHEGEEKFPDHFYETIKASKNELVNKGRIQIPVIVTETRGRYAGAKAKWLFTIEARYAFTP